MALNHLFPSFSTSSLAESSSVTALISCFHDSFHKGPPPAPATPSTSSSSDNGTSELLILSVFFDYSLRVLSRPSPATVGGGGIRCHRNANARKHLYILPPSLTRSMVRDGVMRFSPSDPVLKEEYSQCQPDMSDIVFSYLTSPSKSPSPSPSSSPDPSNGKQHGTKPLLDFLLKTLPSSLGTKDDDDNDDDDDNGPQCVFIPYLSSYLSSSPSSSAMGAPS